MALNTAHKVTLTEAQIYDIKEEDLLRVAKILKAQAKQPTMEW